MLGTTINNLRAQPWFRQMAGFFSWWKNQLVMSLPPAMRSFFESNSARMLAREADGEVLLWRDGSTDGTGQQRELGRFKLADDHDIARQTVQAALADFEGDPPQACYLIDEQEVLVHRLNVPAAAEENLRQVLAYEMDKNTPFTADQVCFDYRIVQRLGTHLRVELVAAPQGLLERIHNAASERGLALHRVDVARHREDSVLALMGVNLLPEHQRAQVDRRQLQLNLGLAALLVLLLYGVMWQSLVSKQRAIEDFQARTTAARVEAQSVAALRSELSEAKEAASFLSERKAANPVVMNVLQSVTRSMPDDVWIQRLQVTQGKVQLTGQATEASALISLLGKDPCLKEPAPKGAFTPDAKSGKERFTIEVFVDCNGEDNGPAATG